MESLLENVRPGRDPSSRKPFKGVTDAKMRKALEAVESEYEDLVTAVGVQNDLEPHLHRLEKATKRAIAAVS